MPVPLWAGGGGGAETFVVSHYPAPGGSVTSRSLSLGSLISALRFPGKQCFSPEALSLGRNGIGLCKVIGVYVCYRYVCRV